MGVGDQRHAPTALPAGKTRYPLYRRLGGPQGRSGRVRKKRVACYFAIINGSEKCLEQKLCKATEHMLYPVRFSFINNDSWEGYKKEAFMFCHDIIQLIAGTSFVLSVSFSNVPPNK